MKNIFHLPSRSKCRLLWAKQAYSEIIKNYESFPLYRETFINGIRKQELNALYLTSLLHLGQEDKVLKERRKILALKESNLLPFFLELNKFSIETMHITANNTMAKALDAIQAISCFEPIDIFWKEYCRNKNIAIVGNAPIETRKGSDINNCDLVLRFNNFRISGYEVSLGNRTDAWCHICDIRPLNSLTQLYESINIDILTDNPLNTIVGNYFLDSTLKFKKKDLLHSTENR